MTNTWTIILGVILLYLVWLRSKKKRSPEEATARAFRSWIMNTAANRISYPTTRDAVIAYVTEKRKEEVKMRTDHHRIAQIREQLYVLECLAKGSKNKQFEEPKTEWKGFLEVYESASDETKAIFTQQSEIRHKNEKRG